MWLNKERVCLVTGASSGIGRATALMLLERGCKVYGTSRNIPEGEVGFADGIRMVKMDVTDENSIAAALSLIYAADGHIDLVVNNAGAGFSGPAEEMPLEDAIAQMDVNFFGMLRVCRAVLPHMRGSNGGRIINIGSFAGTLSIPFQVIYSASKAAIASFTQGVRMEVKPFGIELCCIAPGDTRTDFTVRRKNLEDLAGSPYALVYRKSIAKMEHDEINGVKPERVAAAIVRAASKRKMPVLRHVGPGYVTLALLNKLLPDNIVEFVLTLLYARG